MASVILQINGRDYRIACDDGQEERLRAIGAEIDSRVKNLGKAMGPSQESLLLVITCIMLADELQDTQLELAKLRSEMADSSHSFERNKMIEMEKMLSATIHDIAARIERITDSIN